MDGVSKKVEVSRKVDSAAVGTPKLTTELRAGAWKYQVKLAVGTQQMSLTQSTTITGPQWIRGGALFADGPCAPEAIGCLPLADGFKVEVSADGDRGTMTLWIAKPSYSPVRISTTLPLAGGATMTAELAP